MNGRTVNNGDWPFAVIFDLDGTLVDSAPAIMAALNEVISARGGKQVALDQVRAWISLGVDELVARAFGSSACDPSRDVPDFRDAYGAARAMPEDLYPDTIAMLQTCRARATKLGVCTNKPQHLAEQVLAQVGIAGYFNTVVGGTSSLRPKPSADPISLTLEKLNAPARATILVGDSEIDAAAAVAAGVLFILVSFGYPHGDIATIRCATRLDRFSDFEAAMQRFQWPVESSTSPTSRLR